MITYTPKLKRTVWIMAVVFLLSPPVVEAIFYRTNQARGEYPPPGNQIEIPIMRFIIGSIFLAPLLKGIEGLSHDEADRVCLYLDLIPREEIFHRSINPKKCCWSMPLKPQLRVSAPPSTARSKSTLADLRRRPA